MFRRVHVTRWLAAVAALSLTGPLGAALLCDADLDNDGAVGVTDFLALLAAWGPIAFDFGPQFPDVEAHQIGLEMMGPAGPLLVPPEIYVQTPAVNLFDPNAVIGGQNYWVPSELGNGWWLWDIDDGFWDCFDSCDCHRLYQFRTGPDWTIILYGYQEIGQSWCEF